jgi:GNAT superfamily N-acetyltransferase
MMSSMPPVLRRAHKDDASALAALNVLSWQAAFAGLLPDDFLSAMSVTTQVKRFSRILAGGPSVEVWLAEHDGQILGYASLGPARDEDAADAEELYALYVHPDHWRQGIGRVLHEHVLRRFGERRSAGVYLWVLECNMQARAFYEALRWSNTGQRRFIELGPQPEPMVRYTKAPSTRPQRTAVSTG